MKFRVHTVDMHRHDLEADRVVKRDDHVYLDRRANDTGEEVASFRLDDVAEVRQRAVDIDGRWLWRRCRIEATPETRGPLTEDVS